MCNDCKVCGACACGNPTLVCFFCGSPSGCSKCNTCLSGLCEKCRNDERCESLGVCAMCQAELDTAVQAGLHRAVEIEQLCLQGLSIG